MKITTDDEKRRNQQQESTLSTLLTNYMNSQFQATVSRFEQAKLSDDSPLNKILDVKFARLAHTSSSTQNLANLDTSVSTVLNRSSLIRPNSTPSVQTDNTESLASLQIRESSTLSNSNEKFQDIVQKASQKHGVPVALINAVIHQESSFNANATSHCGAQGLMQLMPKTAQAYGCTNSYDPEQNIMAGTHFLSDLLSKYKGNVTLSLAGYNAGPGNVAKYGNKVPPFEETQDYVVKVQRYYNANLAAAQTANKQFVAQNENATETGKPS